MARDAGWPMMRELELEPRAELVMFAHAEGVTGPTAT
jgi:hypothetical protein